MSSNWTAAHLDDVAEDFQDLAFRQPVLQPGVHHVDDTAACAAAAGQQGARYGVQYQDG
jgi:hypothetical protein